MHPMKFRKRSSVVQAVQWFKPGDHPAVECRTFGNETEIPHLKMPGGHVAIRPGAWIVEETPGYYTVYDPKTFAKVFEPVE